VIDRRAFVAVALCAVAAPLAVRAQATVRVARIGVLTQAPPVQLLREALVQGLRELGYVEGRNYVLEWRDAGSDVARLPAVARELVTLDIDILVATASPAVRAAKDATKTITIIMASSSDAVANGLVASLARPGGNVTGLTQNAPELTAKRLELLKVMLPSLSRVGLIVNQTSVSGPNMVHYAEQAGQTLAIRTTVAWVSTADELERAISQLADQRVQAVLIQLSPLTFGNRARIAELTVARRLPTIGEVREFPDAGLLCGYGPSLSDSYRRAAHYIDKILKGAKPADLPVEQPTKFELVINLKTAKALGLTISQSLLLRADEVIQ
jgi:putative ABC transport system substrate-binding protein